MNNLLNRLAPVRKAVVGFATPVVVVLAGAVLPTSDGGSSITGSEWSAALAAGLATLGLVYKTKNTPKA
jgi:hypothetical protein